MINPGVKYTQFLFERLFDSNNYVILDLLYNNFYNQNFIQKESSLG